MAMKPTVRRRIVVFTVEYETEFLPANIFEEENAIERLCDAAPGEVIVGDDGDRLTPVGWRVEHPDWGDMGVGSLQGRP